MVQITRNQKKIKSNTQNVQNEVEKHGKNDIKKLKNLKKKKPQVKTKHYKMYLIQKSIKNECDCWKWEIITECG